ncbi:HNH endonuclease [Marichromatium sp. AB32]|uniref:HNH endonuclease n=1 Tax=Marichromatium sp. AB32 TaxID=2483363 RepID=UPI0011CD9A3D|nr:HNH endonuclease [Marichromatium sp. AB32]
MESVGATCRNWQWSWSFVNHKKKFIVFGLWDIHKDGLIFNENWKGPGRKQSLEHISLIQNSGYTLKTFLMKQERINNGRPRIRSFDWILEDKILAGDSGCWYAKTPSKAKDDFERDVERSLKDSPENRDDRLRNSQPKPERISVTVTTFKRNPDVVAEVLLRANGKCENCGKDAPFMKRSNNTPYLEVHHKIRLADNGDDTVSNAIALCPNCHRKFHFG